MFSSEHQDEIRIMMINEAEVATVSPLASYDIMMLSIVADPEPVIPQSNYALSSGFFLQTQKVLR